MPKDDKKASKAAGRAVEMFPSLFAQAPTPAPPPESGPLPWVVAFLLVVAILLIVCMPSRKA